MHDAEPARADEAGAGNWPGICPPDRQGPTVGWQPGLPGPGAGKGLEFNVAAEAADRAPDPRESRLGRRRAASPGPVIYCPGHPQVAQVYNT